MDFKQIMTAIALTILVVFGYNALLQYLGKTHPEWGWASTQPTTQPAEATPTTQPETLPENTASATGPTTSSAAGATFSHPPTTQSLIGLHLVATTQPASALLGSAIPSDPATPMSVSLNPRGAAINHIVLNDFRESVYLPNLYKFQEPYNPGKPDDETLALATRSITLDGQVFDLLNFDWTQVHVTNTSVTYRATIFRATAPAVQIDKTYALSPRSTDPNTSQGFEVALTYDVKNLGPKPISAQITYNGPTTLMHEVDRGDDRQVLGGYLHDGFSDVMNLGITELNNEHPTRDFTTDKDGKALLWVGTCNAYFNALIRPDSKQPIRIGNVLAVGLNNGDMSNQKVLMKIDTNTFTVPAGGSAIGSSQVFFGPKKRALLENAYYTTPLLRYNDTLVLKSGYCGFCTFTPIINGLYFLLWIFHGVLRDWGLAIIALVFIVRACLHPITKKSQVNMAKMGKMGPEIERLKKKYGDDKDELNKAMMQFYKTQGATPILGCLPMLLQTPIWIALYAALQSTFDLRQAPFLWGFTWIKDLAHPDRLIYFPTHPVTFWIFHFDSINVLPVLMAFFSVWQAKVTRSQQPPPATKEQAQQQKMMTYMAVFLPIILYTYPSGLNLYILTSNVFGIVEGKIVRKHIKDKEAAEAAGVVIVDGPPPDEKPRPGTVRRKGNQKTEEPPVKKGIMGWLAELQTKAEQMKQDQERQKKKKK